ncbi:HAD family hydrolase [Gulosibacter molinativorax]|uniref:HAD family hydrolase n=1 Tax=Gulosibacter molinativorax TaxID=256821 RepID=A0ABT7C540_9MICO|nr:HAD family hydrolase [Gulosibacter molinativorax]MDJ1370155.1 HAD family hydrolase [Gulosibacter molinativorax]QUY61566.1 Phosphoglycolate phosphatase [Gulosibacter molinativorax]
MTVRHVFWDLGGTLVDSYPSIRKAFLSVLDGTGTRISESELQRMLNVSIQSTIDTLSTRFGIEAHRFDDAYSALKERWALGAAPLMPGAISVMTEVTRMRGLNLIVTNRDQRSADLLVRVTKLRVDDMICASDEMPRKPDPTMHRTLLERHNLDPQDCLGVGDRDIDTLAAQAAGMQAVQLATPGARVPVGVDTIGSLVDLHDYLRP